MSDVLKSIDIGPIGSITLSSGQKLDVPKLTNLKLIKIAKFLGIDGMKLYQEFQGVIANDELSDAEKFVTIVSGLKEEQLVHILAILLDIGDEDALKLDPVETLQVIEVYADNTDLFKAFTIVRNLAKKMFNIEIPDIQGLITRFTTDQETEETTG